MTEVEETRFKRLRMRSWRRGTKEMDMILGPFADVHLRALGAAELDDYERLLSENDQDLYQWITGQAPTPRQHADILDRVRETLGGEKGDF